MFRALVQRYPEIRTYFDLQINQRHLREFFHRYPPFARLPAEALSACTVNAAHVLCLADRGRLAPGLRADIVLLDAPDWRHLAYHLAGDVVHTVVREARVVRSRA